MMPDHPHLVVYEGGRDDPPELPPHDADAEAALLSACLLDGDLVAELPPPATFFGEAHRRIAEAIHAVHADGGPVNNIQVGTWLKNRDRIRQVGGMGFLTELLNAAPAVTRKDAKAYARTVIEHADRRELTGVLRELTATSEASDARPALDLFEASRNKLAAFGLRLAPREALPILGGDLVRSMIGEKPLRRLVTGVATLDAIARGGLPEAKVVIVGGAPGAGKTTLSAQLAFDAARAGWAVAIAVNDGPVEDVLQRLAQLDGFTRDEFDARDPDALARIAERFDALGFIVVDTERCRTIEDASELLVAKRGDRPSLLVIDSAQTSTSRNAQLADGPRGKLDATMAALKHCARFDRHLVIAPSELARGAYSSKNAADRIDDLASFKESGGIEYAADLAIVLRNVRGESDLVGVNVAKSRLGSKSPFCLMLDRRHMRFREVDMPSEEERDLAKTAAATSQLEDDTRTVERFLVEHPGVAGKTGLRLAMRAEGHMLGNTRIDVAVERLGTRIEDRGKHKAPSWHLRSVATMPESE